MQQSDAKLIQQVIQGDPDAFGPLVKKYQKGVHALVWRKIGDFHIAQEITQDAFLNAYQKLGTLKNHNLFAGWLYVIASNLSLDWLRKNRLPMESLDVEDTNEVDKVSYSQYTVEKREAEADENRREVVKELLKKLPESERTVMTLHYLGEMTIKTISEFLGVSQNTVKSRLSRARNRLRKEEDVVRQNLGSFQLPDQFAENIMQEVWRMTPIQPPVSKPMAPLALSAASAVLIFLLIGVGSQYLSRFQKPYNLDATSEPTIELIDAVFVVDSPAKPAVRNQPGSSDTPGKNPGAGQKPDESVFATLPIDTTEVSTPKQQWVQTKGPEGGVVNSLFVASNGDVYARAGADLYRLTDDRSAWISANVNMPINGSWQITEHADTLYVVSDTEVLASADRGRTWNSLGTHPGGQLIDTIITDAAPGAQADITMYLGLVDGVFRSVDAGESWTSLTDGELTDRKIQAIATIENTVFVGTDKGLYRHSSEGWEQLPIGESENINALASAEHRLYVAIGQEVRTHDFSMTTTTSTINTSLSLYRSTDLGDSWQTVDFRKTVSDSEENDSEENVGFRLTTKFNTPKMDDTSEMEKPAKEKPASVKIVAAQERLLVVDGSESYYSSDAGETWISLGPGAAAIGSTFAAMAAAIKGPSAAVISDTDTFYKSGPFGIQRTTDAGKTWQPFNTGVVRTGVNNLIYANNVLYAETGGEIVGSFDSGESWAPLLRCPEMLTHMMKFNDVLYVKGVNGTSLQLFGVSAEDNGLTPVPGMPSLEGIDLEKLIFETFKNALPEPIQDELQENIEGSPELKLEDFDMDTLSTVINEVIEGGIFKIFQTYFGNFAVSGRTYYIEYDQQLFRWKPGMTEWFNTGLVDAGESIHSIADIEDQGSIDFKIAVSGETVYVGKRDGHLFQSFDEGDTWNDVTSNFPFAVTQFKSIVFAGSTVYVATDKGVAYSSDGINWRTATTDAEGTPIVIEKMAVDGTTVYGAPQQQKQIYQLKENSRTWEPVTPEIPSPVISFAVGGNVLYVGTIRHGVFRYAIPLE